MLKPLDNIRLMTATSVKASDDTLKIYPSYVTTLNAMAIGDHTYLTLRQGSIYEVVKYTHAAPIVVSNDQGIIAVVRNQNGDGRKNFAGPVCITFEWNKQALDDYICQRLGAC